MNNQPTLIESQIEELLGVLKSRFVKNKKLHPELIWEKVEARLRAHSHKLWPLSEMERTGGEPDVIQQHPTTGELLIVDCSKESPLERRSLCFDEEALESRKEAKPRGSALGMAAAMGIELLDEQLYRDLQHLGEFDLKTSSWVKTPDSIRALGGSLFGDRRYNQVFVYHNGAESYYGARGFRGSLKV